MSIKKNAGAKPAAKRRSSRNTETQDAVSTIAKELAAAVGSLKNPTMVSSEPMVGIRNISSYVIGLKSPFPNSEADVQLSGPRYDVANPTLEVGDGNMVASISHKWWQQLRKSDKVRKGMIIRDDDVLSAGVPRAPQDPADTLPKEAAVNIIENPFVWIESKSDSDLIDAVEAITSEESLRRILTAVNQRIEKERRDLLLPVEGSLATPEGIDLEEKALRRLPAKYAKAEEIALSRLEGFLRRT